MVGCLVPALENDDTSRPAWFLLSRFNEMEYDPAGNRLQMVATVPSAMTGRSLLLSPDASRSVHYSYDHLNQLTGETVTALPGSSLSSYGGGTASPTGVTGSGT